MEIVRAALTAPAKELGRTLADAALVGAHPVAARRVLLVAKVPGPLAVALTDHLQVYDDGLVDAHRVDLEGLVPVAGVLRALDYLRKKIRK